MDLKGIGILAGPRIRSPIIAVLGSILVFTLLTHCGNENIEDTVITLGPVLMRNPNPAAPLVAILELETDRPTRVSLEIRDNISSWPIQFHDYTTSHSLPVLGLLPDTHYEIAGMVTTPDGNSTRFNSPLGFDTTPLPINFPPIRVIACHPEKMQNGVTLFDARRFNIDKPARYLIIVNEKGQVLWYYNDNNKDFLDVRRNSKGNFLIERSPHEIVEVDLLGNVLKSWFTSLSAASTYPGGIPVATERFHHSVCELPSGNILTLSRELLRIENFPTSEADPNGPKETANVVSDVVVEFSQDGTIVNEWPLTDIIDPRRICYDSLVRAWDWDYGFPPGGTRDWSHANAAEYDPIDDTIMVTCRNQDSVFKFRRNTGELVWILGPPGGWVLPYSTHLLRPRFDEYALFDWAYHPHAASLTPEGNILVYDNGNYRAVPPDPKVSSKNNYSRAVEFRVDMDNMEVTQVWEYGSPNSVPDSEDRYFSPTVGEADWLPQTGNILITHGDLLSPTHTSARLIEVTHTQPSEKVFELLIGTDDPMDFTFWWTYRSERLPSLYP